MSRPLAMRLAQRAAGPSRMRGRCIGCMALVRSRTWKPRSSASPSMAMMSGFMNGSPPVKPISRTGNRLVRDLIEKGDDLGAGDIGEAVVLRARSRYSNCGRSILQRLPVLIHSVRRPASATRARRSPLAVTSGSLNFLWRVLTRCRPCADPLRRPSNSRARSCARQGCINAAREASLFACRTRHDRTLDGRGCSSVVEQ